MGLDSTDAGSRPVEKTVVQRIADRSPQSVQFRYCYSETRVAVFCGRYPQVCATSKEQRPACPRSGIYILVSL
jgi:hypothetical protein